MEKKSKVLPIVQWVLIGLLVVSNVAIGFILMTAKQRLDAALQQVDSAMLQVGELQGEAVGALDTMVVAMEEMQAGTFDYTVEINEEIPIVTDIVVDFTVHVPIKTTIPINQNVTVTVNIPYAGSQNISIPIQANVPVNLTVDVPIHQVIPVNTTVPVALAVPIHVAIADMTIAEDMMNIQAVLEGLSAYLNNLSIELDLMP